MPEDPEIPSDDDFSPSPEPNLPRPGPLPIDEVPFVQPRPVIPGALSMPVSQCFARSMTRWSTDPNQMYIPPPDGRQLPPPVPGYTDSDPSARLNDRQYIYLDAPRSLLIPSHSTLIGARVEVVPASIQPQVRSNRFIYPSTRDVARQALEDARRLEYLNADPAYTGGQPLPEYAPTASSSFQPSAQFAALSISGDQLTTADTSAQASSRAAREFTSYQGQQ